MATNDTNASQRDIKLELAYVAAAVGGTLGLLVMGHFFLAVALFLVTLLMFGIWRIGRGRLR